MNTLGILLQIFLYQFGPFSNLRESLYLPQAKK